MIEMPTTKTFSPKARHIERRWYVVDADGVVLGRLASEVAKILRGKHKPIFAPHVDAGDHVIVVNAQGIRLTGGKEQGKIYYRHSGYPGGLREVEYARLLSDRPVVAVEKAIRGMLPKNRLGRQMIRKLSVYEGAEHPHQAQQPEPLELGTAPRWEGLPVPKPKPEAKPKPKPKATSKSRGAATSAPPAKPAAKGQRRPAKSAKPKPAAKAPKSKPETAPAAEPATESEES